MNTDENKKKIIMLFIALGMIITIITGITFSYLAPTINNLENESTVAFNAGVIAIDFKNGTSQIEVSDILPGWSETKTFSLTAINTTSIRKADAMNYSLKLIVESNTFSDNAISVSLKSTNTSNNGTIAEIIPGTLLSGASEVSLGFGSFDATKEIGAGGVTHDFELTVSFPEQYRSQSSDMGKHLSAHVTIGKANDLGTLTIADSYEKANITTSVEKNKEVTLLSLYKYPVNRSLSIVSGEGTIKANKLTLKSDEMKVVVNYPSITNTISGLNNNENGLEVDDTTDKNLRYVGASPKNYITFNGEIWRIIGIFNVYNTETGKYEKLTKIIRNESLGNYSWDTTDSTINNGDGINEWSQADLMYELNCDGKSTKYCRDDITEGYLSNKTSGATYWYNGNNNAKNGSYDYSKNIRSTSIEQIANVRWNTSRTEIGSGALNSYNKERSTTLISTPSDNVPRTNTWDGKIALIYLSDYGYSSTDPTCRSELSSSNCKNENWLFYSSDQWTLSPHSGFAISVFDVGWYGGAVGNVTRNKNGVRPALFLKSDVVITGGTGDEKDPYTVSNYNAFRDDSWATIANNVKNGNTSLYNVGDTRKITVDGTNYTVRLANNSTPSECDGTNFSQTACGFVVEFAEVVFKRNINPSGTHNGTQFKYGWNVGGWPASDMRNNYVNGDFFKKLPNDLQKVIIDTKVISGHGNTSGETNFTSTDKIYLLSPHEVYEDGTSNKVSTSDTAYSQTRQLDYYKSKGVTTTNYSSAAKKFGTETSRWWLRSARKDTNVYFISATEDGKWGSNGASGNYGFSPAFRIGVKENTVTPTSFAEDSWETIAAKVKVNPAAYAVGSTKKLKVYDNPNGETTNGTYKEYTVRVANNTTPAECNNGAFSQSACGFVVEFVDIVERRRMNSTYTNVGGWPDTEIRTYANGEFFNKLPSELQNVIMDTKVISGHGSEDTSNLISTDKIYLLSSHEIWSNKVTHNSNDADTAYSQTRQLDYYSSKGVTTDSYSGAIKQYNSSNDWWWLRTATYFYSVDFLAVYSDGAWRSDSANNSTRGFAPAFRIG